MKKIQLFFAAIAFIAVTSAFATKAKTTDEYILINGRFELLDPEHMGHCDLLENSFCTYEKVRDNGVDPYTEPTNFDGIGPDTVYVP